MASRIIFSIFLGIAFTYVVQAQLVVPGKCPDFPAPAECPPEPDDECRNDVNCAELYPGQGLKCCKDGCDKVCTRPILPLTSRHNQTKPRNKNPGA
ncbi:uncharacterized protein LOC116295477 isoform X2 [Actinia tenebrosa]|uniref:Uncharacterized protein LOC116295477 isoform X2 n=1 Tax=Actinia tenebrosa TaxID=6105 RepID=A0A6P8I2S9_ACTTE|nr:uncharacterized protein LOC116295477 isoform X2 [Actinia tenebrosa]XP_031559155.1 uncharacterized protein LOC116295477 isoform X2 [Actinia tenebrosa]